mmetsp:Transcript_13822/g.44240  ORF Transcript_13822/g.44240 Transcript_13822/m.44240 type:complete len:271 (+) Transcript_13822:172-984(+)
MQRRLLQRGRCACALCVYAMASCADKDGNRACSSEQATSPERPCPPRQCSITISPLRTRVASSPTSAPKSSRLGVEKSGTGKWMIRALSLGILLRDKMLPRSLGYSLNLSSLVDHSPTRGTNTRTPTSSSACSSAGLRSGKELSSTWPGTSQLEALVGPVCAFTVTAGGEVALASQVARLSTAESAVPARAQNALHGTDSVIMAGRPPLPTEPPAAAAGADAAEAADGDSVPLDSTSVAPSEVLDSDVVVGGADEGGALRAAGGHWRPLL